MPNETKITADPTDYALILEQARALFGEETHQIAGLANASALIFHALKGLNWAGFYLLEDQALILGPFQGKVACVKIPLGHGVCGTAAKEDRMLIVDDVHRFPGHIACDGASRSEIVIPLHQNGRVAGVLDLDSPLLSRFTEADGVGLSALARLIESALF